MKKKNEYLKQQQSTKQQITIQILGKEKKSQATHQSNCISWPARTLQERRAGAILVSSLAITKLLIWTLVNCNSICRPLSFSTLYIATLSCRFGATDAVRSRPPRLAEYRDSRGLRTLTFFVAVRFSFFVFRFGRFRIASDKSVRGKPIHLLMDNILFHFSRFRFLPEN